MRNKRISVMGCGWLGLPLAQELVQLGYQVKGSTTTSAKLEMLQESAIKPFLISFPESTAKKQLQEFLDADVIIFNLPPTKAASETASYESLLQAVLQALPTPAPAFLFVSSTSVYPDLNREVVENDAVASAVAASLMLRSEYLVQQSVGLKATLVRFGGLMGGNRHPGRFLAGKTGVPQPDAPVNMIHLLDCVGLLTEIISQGQWSFTFNACAPEHPARKDFYTAAALQFNLPPPVFKEEEQLSYKKINSDLIQTTLSYQFRLPDPLAALSSPDF